MRVKVARVCSFHASFADIGMLTGECPPLWLQVEALVSQLHESRSQDVWQKCSGCLMVLAANSDKVKALAGQEGAISELAAILRKSEHNKPTLKAALGALAVLTSDEKNVQKLRQEGIALDTYAKDKDERIQMFVSQLMDRLYGQE